MMQTHTDLVYDINPEAPCALCDHPSPQHRIDITIDKPQKWGTGIDKFTFHNLPLCDGCRKRHQGVSGKFFVFLGVVAFSCVIGLFAGGYFQILFVVGLLVGLFALVSWRNYNRSSFKKIETWAEKYISFSDQ